MDSREDRYEEPKVVITIPHNSPWAYRGPVKGPIESSRIIMGFGMMLSFGAFLAAAVGVLQSPISRDYYFDEISHCFSGKCFTGPEADKRLNALGVKYKNSPENYAYYKTWKFQQIEDKKKPVQKPRWMTD
jgi:hypothetical protein